MRRSSSSDTSRGNDNKTMLPPIRDLFRDELSRSPRPPRSADPNYSPSASLAQLNLRATDNDNAPYDTYAYSSRRLGPQSHEYPHGHAGHSALGLSSVPPPSSTSSHLLPPPTSYASSFPPDRQSSTNLPPSSARSPHLTDHYRSKSLSNSPAQLRQSPSYPERQYHISSSRPGSSLNPEVDWHSRRASVSHPQQYSQSGAPYGRNPYGAPVNQALDSAGGSSGRGRSGSDTGVDRSASGKYECQYCGKGFNRPSSLKIHINSHTGEKPFTCPHEGCGRTFSVLSNMRRHARVHVQPQGALKEGSSDDFDASDGGYSASGSPSYSPPMPLESSLSSSAVGTVASPRAHPYLASAIQSSDHGSPGGHTTSGRRRQSSSSGSARGSRSRSMSSDEGDL